MPRGTPFHGFIPPFPIRVDQFGPSPGLTAVPALHLLSHTHSDHILGLTANSFASTIICSPDAKQMLLRHEPYRERFLKDIDLREEVRLSRTFGHLKVPPFLKGGKFGLSAGRDLLRTLPLNSPTTIELSDNLTVTLTLFDANHCPGAVMFLIESSQGAVLHTGDFRAEPWFLDDIRRNPFLQPYLVPPNFREGIMPGKHGVGCSETPLFKTLDAIYLDTECLLMMDEVPTKSNATRGLVSLMSLFPTETTFFINAWTWGYEEIFRAIAHSFRSQIHVDRYKHNIYSRLSDPFLRSLITLDASKSRFHACERFHRCPHASRDDVIYINPVTIGKSKWDQYLALTESKLRAAQPVTVLLVPLLRHSPLQELRAFVSLFRPVRVVPNSLDPSLHDLDALCIPKLFASCLSTPPSHVSSSFAGALVEGDIDISEDQCDSALQNLVGDGADCIARAWAVSGRVVDKLTVMEPFLSGAARDIVRRTLRLPRLPSENSDRNEGAVSILQRTHDRQRIDACRTTVTEYESDRDTESEEDGAHARTATLLFGFAGRGRMAGSQGIPQERTRSFESPSDRCLPVEDGSDGDTLAALHAPTPPESECDFREKFAKGTSSAKAISNLASLQTQLITSIHTKGTPTMHLGDDDDENSSFCAATHMSSLSPITLPASNSPHLTTRHDPPLTDLQNIPPTGTKRASVNLCSLGPANKRSKVEKSLYTGECHVLGSPRKKAPGPPGAAAMEAQKSTGVAPESSHMDEHDPDVDRETRRFQRRALRARSRVIEEKLRHVLVMDAR